MRSRTIRYYRNGVLVRERQHTRRGDCISVFAQPIARLIDKFSGGRTRIQTCGGCQQMQRDLNAGMGFWPALRKRLKLKRLAKRSHK